MEEMQLSEKDHQEIKVVQEILQHIADMNTAEAEEISDRIVAHQPFMMSMLLGFRIDFEPDQLEGIFGMMLIIYLFFERCTDIAAVQITEGDMDIKQQKNIDIMLACDQEQNVLAQDQLSKEQFANLHSRALLAGVLGLLNEDPELAKMENHLRGILLCGMQSLIECLEDKLM